jgi:hypothetical protein
MHSANPSVTQFMRVARATENLPQSGITRLGWLRRPVRTEASFRLKRHFRLQHFTADHEAPYRFTCPRETHRMAIRRPTWKAAPLRHQVRQRIRP